VRIKKKSLKLTAFTALIAVGVVITGCAGVGTAQAGWSGVTAGDGSVYLGSAGGKLVALNVENGFYQWQENLEGSTTSTGLGCAGAAPAVIYATPVLSGETLYVGDYSGRLYAYNINDRQSKSVLLNGASSKSIIGSPLVHDGTIFTGSTDGSLYAFDAASLTFKWKYDTGGEIWAAPAAWQNSIFVASFDKKVYSLNSQTGQPNWDAPFECDGPIIASPVVYGDMVIVASLDRHVYALDAVTGELLWAFPAGDGDEQGPSRWLWAAPVAENGTLFVAGMDGLIYVLNSASGQLAGTIDLEAPVAATPVIAGSRLVAVTDSGRIFSIDTTSYQKIELRNLDAAVTAPLGADNGTVYIHSVKESTVYAVNGETGALLWSTTIE